ncbi:MAG: 2Fe-2S iron-sulfur cluster-binding protein [Armatimonadota bacterium]|jgi:heterodisulfide reductase subunit A
MVTLTIDDRQVEVEEGSTVLDAAKELGVEIPTLCFHPSIEPYSACRVCLVQIGDGDASSLAASCSYPVQDDLVVRTDTPEVLDARKMMVELLMARAPKAEKVRELATDMGIEKSRFPAGDEDEECILCGLCVRVCDEVVGKSIVNFVNRGDEREVTTAFSEPSADCITCAACALVCPTECIKIEEADQVRHSELQLGPPKAIHVPFAQAVPNVPVIDTESCIHSQTEGCKFCETVCEPEAITFETEEKEREVDVGAIVVATGFKPFDPARTPQYGYGRLPNVISGLEFEMMSNASGPTGGDIVMQDGSVPRSVGIIHCVGSRDENNNPYCSRVCCMYAMKFAHLVREKLHDADVYEFYIDVRAFGKGYEEFYERVLSEDVIFVRGKGAEVTEVAETPEEEGKLTIKCEDTLLGEIRRIPVDMVVLAVGLEPHADSEDVAHTFSLSCADGGFFLEQHPKLAPVSTSTDGVMIAGACQGPKDIPDSVAQGAAAAAEALSLIDAGRVAIEPITSAIDEDLCAGCKTCIELCPYTAIEFDDEKKISKIEEVLCKGCGTCVAACPSGAAHQRGFSDKQILAELEGALLVQVS